MNQEMKNKVYSEIYSELKVDQDVTELGYPAERKNFDFSCKIKGIFFLFKKFHEILIGNCILLLPDSEFEFLEIRIQGKSNVIRP